MQLDIAVLQEQKVTLVDKLDFSKVDAKHRQETDAAVITECRAQLSRQGSDSRQTIQSLERRADEAERNLADANHSTEDLRAEMTRKLREAKIPLSAHKDEIIALDRKLQEKECLIESLTQRANTIGGRYKEGDLVGNVL